MLPITAIILTNTTDHLEEAVRTLSHFNELIIVTNSVSIQKKNLPHPRAKIIPGPHRPITDFSAVRNAALKNASNDWVFFLDSDEELQPFDANTLMHRISNSQATAYTITRQDVFLGKKLKYGEAGNQQIVRLVHKKFSQFTGSIHETATTQGSISASELHVLHFAHKNVSTFLADVTKYATEIGTHKNQPQHRTLIELVTYPPAKFIFTFIIKQGFRDGIRGFVYSVLMSLHSLIVRISTYETATKK